MQAKKKVLLLGGTGAMGVYLVPVLVKAGYQVYITSRKEHVSNEADVVFITGNAKNKDFVQTLLKQHFDVIVDFMIYKTEEFRERYLELLDSTSHYLFLSSYRVYGDNHGRPITEDSPRLLDSVDDKEYLATDEYALTKARQENLLRESGRSNWTILRPAITYSKERFQLGTLEAQEFLSRALKGKTIIFPEQMLDKQATMSWAGDVAELIAKMVLNQKAMGETFTVSTSEHHTWREIMEYYIELVGMNVKIVDLSVYERIIGRPYQIKYDRMFDRIIDNSKALEVTGMRQEDFMPLKEGLRMELANFVKNPVYKGYSAALDKKIDQEVQAKVSGNVMADKGKFETRKENRILMIRAKILKLPGFRQLKSLYLKLKER